MYVGANTTINFKKKKTNKLGKAFSTKSLTLNLVKKLYYYYNLSCTTSATQKNVKFSCKHSQYFWFSFLISLYSRNSR